MGLEAMEAMLPLMAPAAMLRNREGFSFVAPINVLVGP